MGEVEQMYGRIQDNLKTLRDEYGTIAMAVEDMIDDDHEDDCDDVNRFMRLIKLDYVLDIAASYLNDEVVRIHQEQQD
jgi:hypothetical protein